MVGSYHFYQIHRPWALSRILLHARFFLGIGEFTLSLCASKASASKQASKRASVRTMSVVTDVTDSVTRREARGLEARIEAAQTVSIALGAIELSHVGKRMLSTLSAENPSRVLTATQVLILIGDDGEPWPESRWKELHASCEAAILSASDGTVDELGDLKASSFRIPVKGMLEVLRHLKVEERLAFLTAAQSTPVRASAAAQVGAAGVPPDNQQQLVALAKSAATKLKERLVTSKEYLSQQDAAYRHHTVLPSDACVGLFPEWLSGTIPKFPTLEEVNKVGTGLGTVEGRKSPLLNLVTAFLAAARAYAAPVPEELIATYVDLAPLNSQEKPWSLLDCTVETVTAGVKATATVKRPVQLPARLVDEAIEVLIAVGSCLSKRQQKDLVLEVWSDWQRIMSTTNLLAKSLRTATELGGSQNGLSRASALSYNDECTVCQSWTVTLGKGKGSGGKSGKGSKGKPTGKSGGGRGGKSNVKWTDQQQQPKEARCDVRKNGGHCENRACSDCYSGNKCVALSPTLVCRDSNLSTPSRGGHAWTIFREELLRTVCPDCLPSSHARAWRDEIYRRRGGVLSQVNALILERLLRTPPFAKLACDPHSAHARLACCLGYIPSPSRSY